MGSKTQKMHSILEEIVEKKQKDLERLKQNSVILREVEGSPTKELNCCSGFLDFLSVARNDKILLIAELKFASPTLPHLGTSDTLLERAKVYEEAGADMVSIITEEHFFNGDPSFVTRVKQHISLPILQKDFVIDPFQIYQAKEIGSDALLLIARLVSKEQLQEFVSLCFSLEIEPVVEINDEEDLAKAIASSPNVIAVNARDLQTFVVDVDRACLLLKKIPSRFIRLGFSGIKTSEEVQKYRDAGVNGVLVGTSLMQSEDSTKFILSLTI